MFNTRRNLIVITLILALSLILSGCGSSTQVKDAGLFKSGPDGTKIFYVEGAEHDAIAGNNETVKGVVADNNKRRLQQGQLDLQENKNKIKGSIALEGIKNQFDTSSILTQLGD